MVNVSPIIADLDKQIEQLNNARNVLVTLGGDGRKRRGTKKMSVAARKRIAAAQKARWSAWKAKHKK